MNRIDRRRFTNAAREESNLADRSLTSIPLDLEGTMPSRLFGSANRPPIKLGPATAAIVVATLLLIALLIWVAFTDVFR